MSEMILDQVEGGFTEVVDPDHAETVMQGVIDTVDGVESMTGTYTAAQRYLYSCLDSSDTITHNQRRDGMEGVVSAIGSGLNTMWEYIKKMFKSIWEFFFGSGEGSASSGGGSSKKVVEENTESIKEVANSTPPAETVEKVEQKVKKKIKKIKESPKASSQAKTKAKQVEEKLEKATEGKKGKEKAAAVKEAANEIVKADEEGLTEIKGICDQLLQRINKWKNPQDNSSKIKDPKILESYREQRKTIMEIGAEMADQSEFKNVLTIDSLQKAIAAQKDIADVLEGLSDTVKHFRSAKDQINTQVSGIEAMLNMTEDKRDKKTLNIKLTSLKELGGFMFNIHSDCEVLFNICKRLSDAVAKLVNVK